MTLLAIPRTTFRRSLSFPCWTRGYVSASNTSSGQPPKSKNVSSEPTTTKNASSCPAGTVLTGLNYLKGEPPIVAKPDEEYPPWLWDLAKPKVLADDGPGGKAEKRQLRLSHRQTLKDNNMFKAK